MCKEKGINVPQYKEQYQFRKAIVEYWINPDLIQKEAYQGKGEKKYDVDVFSPSSQYLMLSITNPFFECSNIATSGGTKDTCRVVPIIDGSLDARNGALVCRFDQTLGHLAEKPTVKRARCGLHWWGAKVRKKLI